MSLPEPGSPAPSFSIEAAVSGREVSNEAISGRRGVLVFHGPKTTDAPKTVGKAVRAKFPDASTVMVANIVDLRSMSGMWKKVASAQIKSTYDKLAGKLTEVDPADYVVMCPDWDNQVGAAFGIEDANSQAAVVVLGNDGKIAAAVQGDDLADAAVAALGE